MISRNVMSDAPNEPPHGAKKYEELESYADSKDDLLRLLVKYPGVDPYSAVSGIVRMVAVDRWCNELMNDGFVFCWEDDDGKDTWCTVTPKGREYAALLKRMDTKAKAVPVTREQRTPPTACCSSWQHARNETSQYGPYRRS